MENIKGENIGALPFKKLKKITDLINFEGPVLSHFKDEYGKNILFYWVDNDDKLNRWIIFQITEQQLYGYLLKKDSLRDIFEYPFNDIFYTVDIGDKLEYTNINQIFKDSLNNEYLPESTSIYDFEIPSVYKNKIHTYEESYLKETFLEAAMYVKAEPRNSKIRPATLGLVRLLDASDLLLGYGKSFKGLVEYKVAKKFVEQSITDIKRIRNATIQVLNVFQPNILKTEIKSFSVAFSPNSFTPVNESFLDKTWKDDLFKTFKEDIIEIDKKSLLEIDKIVNEYGEDYIYDIYKPLIDLYNNKNIIINITDRNFVPKRTINPIKKEVVAKLTGNKKEKDDEIIDRFGLLKFHTKSGKVTAGLQGLFDQSIQPFWSTIEIKTEKASYKLKHTLHANYKRENGVEIIENEDLNIFASGEHITEAETDFFNQFQDLYEKLGFVENIELSAEDIEIKKSLLYFIKG